jgi:hypothetical protein
MDTPIFINMKYYFAPIISILCFFLLVLLSSCSSLPVETPDLIYPPANEPALTVPEKGAAERPRPPEEIMGKGMAAEEKLALFLMSGNSKVDSSFARSLAGIYIEEAAAEGVNHDVAFAQMCLETGSLQYGGLVTPDMNNFCGLGSTGARTPDGQLERGNVFPDPRTGVRAHIQHLKAYATKEPLNQDLVDPRYSYVRLGISPTIHGLTGRWAMDVHYGKKIAAILNQIYETSF